MTLSMILKCLAIFIKIYFIINILDYISLINCVTCDLNILPGFVSIQKYSLKNLVFKHVCGGVIVNERWVVTVANCFDSHRKDRFRVVLGIELDKTDYRISNLSPVSEILLHPEYKKNIHKSNYDISILKLQKPLFENKLLRYAVFTSYDRYGGGSVLDYSHEEKNFVCNHIVIKKPIYCLSKHHIRIEYFQLCGSLKTTNTCLNSSGIPVYSRKRLV